MKSEIKAAWLKALRSGDYTQGRGTLSMDGKFCCLGVLADVLQKDFPETYTQAGCRVERHSATGAMEIYFDPHAARSGGLPKVLTEVIDMDYAAQDDLAHRNDDGQDFLTIANVIEGTL